MSQLAKIDVGIAPACPNCRQRVMDMDLDKLAAGAEHQCLLCGHSMRVPKAILDRLIAQRDAAIAAGAKPPSFFERAKLFFVRLFAKKS